MSKNFKQWCVVAFLSAIAVGFISTAIQTTQSRMPELDQSKETKELREKFDRDYNQIMEDHKKLPQEFEKAKESIEKIKEIDKKLEQIDTELEKEREGAYVSPDERLNN